ncbi:hypothetical protein CsSME_00043152 [Camellia sinensis var. sinensis]
MLTKHCKISSWAQVAQIEPIQVTPLVAEGERGSAWVVKGGEGVVAGGGDRRGRRKREEGQKKIKGGF